MADKYIGAAVGDTTPNDLQVAASTNSTVIELRVTTGAAQTQIEVLKCIEAIKNKVATATSWPLANT